MIFKHKNTIDYPLSTDIVKKKTVSNIFDGVIADQNTVDGKEYQNFRYLEYPNRNRIDQVAHDIYKDSNTQNMILLTNNVLNPHFDVCMSEEVFQSYLESKYEGTAFFLSVVQDNSSSSSSSQTQSESSQSQSTSSTSSASSASSSSSFSSSSSSKSSSSSSSNVYSGSESLSSLSSSSSSVSSNSVSSASSASSSSSTIYESFTEGETVRLDTTITGTVTSYDATLRKLTVKDITDSTGADVTVSSLDGNVVEGLSSGAQGTIDRVVEFAFNAVHHFEDSDGYVLDSLDYINAYIGGSDTNVVTVTTYEQNLNEQKRILRKLNDNLVGEFVSKYKLLVDGV